MVKIAYLDCFSGISGDMFLGAMLDAGLALDDLNAGLKTLPLDGYRITVKRELRNHLAGTRFLVEMGSERPVERHLSDIRKIIEESGLSVTIKQKGIDLFSRIAEVEGYIHNLHPEKVHFHEVGAVDSIVDIMGGLIGVECLGIRSFYCSAIPIGSGFIKTAHGAIPIPAPAAIELLKDIPVYDSTVKNELVTPTGAALLRSLVTSFGQMPAMVVRSVGYGVGGRELEDRPNMLRILIGEQSSDPQVETVVILETNLDNTNPEWMGYLMEQLFEAGALDVIFFPVQMKKNRPGIQIQVIGCADQRQGLIDILFRETATLGVRFRYSQREVLDRSEAEVESPWGMIKVKRTISKDGTSFIQPEYDACREIALKQGLSLKDIYNWVMGLNQKG